MKKCIFLASFVLLFSFGGIGIAQDVSLDLVSDVTVSDLNDFNVTLYEKAIPSFYIPLGSAVEFAGSGYIKPTFSTGDEAFSFNYGLELLRLEIATKDPVSGMKSFTCDLGRFTFSDPSGYVLSSPADGASFFFRYPDVQVAVRSAYTGLLFRDDSQIMMSLADRGRIAEGTDFTGSPRFISEAEIAFPRVFDQFIVLSFLAQTDLNSGNNVLSEGDTVYAAGEGGKFNTQYFGLKSTGGISTASYTAFCVYGTGSTLSWIADTATSGSYQYKPVSSFLGGLNVSVPLRLPQPFSGTSVAGQLLIASGDRDASDSTEGNTDGMYTAFSAMNTTTLANVFSPNLSNLVLAGANFATSLPVSSYRVDGTAGILAFFRPTAGPVSVSGIDPNSTSSYLGTELDLGISSRILSDVALSFKGGIFFPGNAFASANRALQYSADLTVMVSM